VIFYSKMASNDKPCRFSKVQRSKNRCEMLQGKLPTNLIMNLSSRKNSLILFSSCFDTPLENLCACFIVGKLAAEKKISYTKRGEYNHFRRLIGDNTSYLREHVSKFLVENELHNELTSESLSPLDLLKSKFSSECRFIQFQNCFTKRIVDTDTMQAGNGDLDFRKQIYLLKSEEKEGFYDLMIRPWAVFGLRSMCKICFEFPFHLGRHLCTRSCPKCKRANCKGLGKYRKCDTCLEYFRGDVCYNGHLYACAPAQQCEICGGIFRVTQFAEHLCNDLVKCPYCAIEHPMGLCYIQSEIIKQLRIKKLKQAEAEERAKNDPSFVWEDSGDEVTGGGGGKGKSPELKRLYFDIETIQNKKRELEVVLLVAKYFHPNTGKPEIKVFESGDIVQEFLNFLLQATRIPNSGRIKYLFEDFVVLAHNAKSFDNVFVLNKAVQNKELDIKVVYSGSKINMIRFANKEINIVFKDTLNFMPHSLDAMPGVFGISGIRKTKFPYRKLIPGSDGIDYVGPLPPKDDFDTLLLKTDKDRAEFDVIYAEMELKYSNTPYVLKQVLREYCINDVEVLQQCAEKYAGLVKSVTGFDPFLFDLTLAGVCMRDFMENHMLENSIGIVPNKGYFAKDKQSKKALEYFKFLEWALNTKFQHSNTAQGEYRLGRYKLDAISHEKKLVVDFHGCYIHGCNSCYSKNDYGRGEVPQSVYYMRTKDREHEIREMMKEKLPGYEYKAVWEHVYDSVIKTSEKFEAYLEATSPSSSTSSSFVEPEFLPVTDRGSFYGGRTNCTKFYAEVEQDSRIYYVDVCSLYPYVCKYRPYPRGHPIVIREKFNYEANAYFGVMACKLIPPKKLYHPVIPAKINNRLMFPLCRTCAEKKSQDGDCFHSDNDRALYGEWNTPEVYQAMSQGYRLEKIYSVIHYTEKFEYKDELQSGLFGAYVNKWLKLKAESSGFPANVKTEEEKKAYVQAYKQDEGVTLELEKIKENVGMRSLAKLFLNSLWGRFGLNMEKSKCEFVREPSYFHDIMVDGTLDIELFKPLGENKNVIFVAYKEKEEFRPVNLKGNPIIASFVAMWGRLELLQELTKLDKRVLYFDTDSIIFTHKHGEYKPKMGSKLGEWGDEILSQFKDDSVYIQKYSSMGPKAYSLVLSNGIEINKLKGLTQNLLNKPNINFNKMRRCIPGYGEEVENEEDVGGFEEERDEVEVEEGREIAPSESAILCLKPINFVRNKFANTIHNNPATKTVKFNYFKRRRIDDSFDTVPHGYNTKDD
jgi:hypothetical protein